MDNLMKLVDIKEAYDFKVGETVAVDGRLAKGYGTVIEVSWTEPLADVTVSPEGEDNGRPFPPHIRVEMIGARAELSGTGKFLFHQDDIIADKLRKLSDIDFV